MITIQDETGNKRYIEDGKPFRLLAGEKIMPVGLPESGTRRELTKIAESASLGLGETVLAITTSTGFKLWYDKKHGGNCLSCKKRQAALDYIGFKGPLWLVDWIRKQVKKSDS